MSRSTMTIQFPTVGLLFLVLAACHPGPVTVDEDTVPDLPADDLPPPCEAPLIECGGDGEEACTVAQAENPVMLQQVGCDVLLPDAFAASGIVEQENFRYFARCCCDNPEE